MKKSFYSQLIITMSLLLFIGIISLVEKKSLKHPHVEQGVMDLTNWSFEHDGIIDLKGEWGFMERLTNEPFEAVQQFATVPGKLPIDTLQGAGTYYAKVLLPEKFKGTLAVGIEGVRMSHALFVDGERIHVEGQPANERTNYEPRNVPYTVDFEAEGHAILLSVQVANFDYYQSGIHLPLFLGLNEQIEKKQMLQIILEACVFLLSLVVAFVFLVVYFSFDKQRNVLILGSYFLVLATLVVTTNQKNILQFMPDLSFLTIVKIRDFAMYFSIPLLIYYVKSLFPTVKSGWLLVNVIGWIYFIYSVLSVCIPYRVLGGAGDFVLLPFFTVAYVIIALTLWQKYRQRATSVVSEKELEYFLLLIIAETGIIVSTVLYYSNMIHDLVLMMLSSFLTCLYTILMFLEKCKKTYLSMEHYAEKLEQQNLLKDEFLSKTAHELKTPLHGIINLAQLSIDHVRQNDMTVVENNNLLIKSTARRMALIVNDLVDFSLIQEERFRMTMKTIDILYCVRSVVEVMNYQAHEKNVRFQLDIADEARYAMADEARFIQVIYNLVQNSLQHTKDGSITISSSLKHQKICVAVLDTGRGIPQSDFEKIFEAYEQGSNRLNSGGLGLGLAISKQLLQQMNGELSLDWSAVGQGTKFSIIVQQAELPASEAVQLSLPEEKVTSLGFQSNDAAATILLVDDEPLNRQVLREILTYHDGEILEAENGAQVFALLESNVIPDIILLDVMLEDWSGYEICQQIRSSFSLIELPILFITVNHSIRDISQAFLAGGNDFLTKPFEAEEVRARVDTLLNMKAMAQQATENEMAFLQSQIKPHFLFNTLSAIMAYSYEDGEKTRALLESLSIYLRTVFQTSKQTEWMELKTELELTMAFVNIQRQRYGERVHVAFQIDESVLDCLTPPLLLQPLVENAISHGVLKRSFGGYVTIKIEQGDNGIAVTVADNGIGMSAAKVQEIVAEKSELSGVGLANVQKRVARLTNRSLIIESQEDVGTSISYWLPYMLKKEVVN